MDGSFAFTGQDFAKELIAANLVPKGTISIDLHVAVNEVVTITTKSHATKEQIDAIKVAFNRSLEEGREIARLAYFVTPSEGDRVGFRL